jgi:hypothetical protein
MATHCIFEKLLAEFLQLLPQTARDVAILGYYQSSMIAQLQVPAEKLKEPV